MKLYWRYKKDGKWNWKPVRHYPVPGKDGACHSTGVRTYRIYLEVEEE